MRGASGPFTDLRSRSPRARCTSSSRHEVPPPPPRQGSGGPPEAQGAVGARVLGPGRRSATPRLPGGLGRCGGFLTDGGALVPGLQVRPRAASGTPAFLRGGHGGPERLREHGPAHLCPLQPGERACKPGRCPTRHGPQTPRICSHRPGGWRSRIRARADSVPSESPSRPQTAVFCLCPHAVGRNQCPLVSPPARALSRQDPGMEPSVPP